MQITNDYASTLDLFGTSSTSANKTEEEQSGTTLFGSDGDSVTISDEARQLYAQQGATSESAAPAAPGGGPAVSGGGDSGDRESSDSQIQNILWTQMGIGISLVPLSARSMVNSDKVIFKRIVEAEIHTHTVVAWLKNRTLSSSCNHFLELFRKKYIRK